MYFVFQDALLNELSILRTLDHPNIIKHIGSYEDENGYYIVTELLDDEHCLHKGTFINLFIYLEIKI